ncbi:uncharacterized protein MONBRDRAFT_6196 [Monosiga brevicollis MX1]|uniref:Protein kinase domain-containing protein n=1 Tax=Monosiga brevicollis TaxID=81824 RepID=A9UT42_MONBE|nr:uncharacterized protein MONBRDRAFT_6196 [Monosiga brevicollis MX1]EDQ91179.1 predicted protein [Monosiga brevicollis MX1]|eukprot:XP_001743601.1 hypothetical protein [Monosiga brevicollis MX1]
MAATGGSGVGSEPAMAPPHHSSPEASPGRGPFERSDTPPQTNWPSSRERTLSDNSTIVLLALEAIWARAQQLHHELLDYQHQQQQTHEGHSVFWTPHPNRSALLSEIDELETAAVELEPAKELGPLRAEGVQIQLDIFRLCTSCREELAMPLEPVLDEDAPADSATPQAASLTHAPAQPESPHVGVDQASPASSTPLLVHQREPPSSLRAGFEAAPNMLRSESSSGPVAPRRSIHANLASGFVQAILEKQFADGESHAAFSTLARHLADAWARIRHLPLARVAHDLEEVNVRTLADLATLSSSQLQSLVTSFGMGGSAASSASSVPNEPVHPDTGASSHPGPASHTRTDTPSTAARSGQRADGPATSTRSVSSGGASAFLHARLLSLLDRGVVQCLPHQILGNGRFGYVYRCEVNNQPAALKMVQVGTEASAFPATMRVVEEAKHLMALRHPNILGYLDVFGHQVPMGGGNFVCILMELCDLGTLADAVFEGRIDFGGMVDAIRQIAAALAYAHGQGVVHADIKLENVLVRRGPERDVVKVGDWGIARREPLSICAPPLHNVTEETLLSDTERALFTYDHAALLPEPSRGDTPVSLLSASDRALAAAATAARTRTQASRIDSHGPGRDAGAAQGHGHPLSTPRGTVCYQPPEAFDFQLFHEGFRWACDIWGLGCVLYETVTQNCLPLGQGFIGQLAARADEAPWLALRAQLLQHFALAVQHAECRDPTIGRDTVRLCKQQLGVLLTQMWAEDCRLRPPAADILAQLPSRFQLRVAPPA